MSAIFLPRRWRHQPQGAVEVDPRWADRVIVAALPRGGSRVEAITPTAHFDASPSLSESADYGVGVGGFFAGSTLAGSGTHWNVGAADALDASAGFSLLACALNTNSTVWSTRSAIRVNRYSGAPYRIGFSMYDSASIAAAGVYSGITRYRSAANSYPLDRAFTFAGRFQGSLSNDAPDVYVDGQKNPGATSAKTGSGSLDTFKTIDAFGAGLGGRGFMAAALLLLSDAELCELTINPWQILRAPSHRIFFDLGAANAIPTLSLAGVQDVGKTSARPKVTLTF